MFISDVLAIAAAICAAASGMLIHELNGRVDIFRFGRWQMATAFVVTVTGSLAVGGWRTIQPWQFGMLAASSLSGIIIASTAYYAAIFAAGPRITALLYALAAPIALGLGYIVFGEMINLHQGVGVALVLAGIVLAIGLTTRRTTGPATPADAAAPGVPWLGIGFGLILAVGQALGSLLSRPVMASGVDPLTGMAIRAGIAGAFYFSLPLLPFGIFRKPYVFSARTLAIGIGAGIIGTGIGMPLLMAALAKGNVGIVSTLSSMTPVIVLPMIWARSGKVPQRAAWVGAIMAVCGTALISV